MARFADYIETSPERVLIVDALNLAYRWLWGKATVFADDYVSTVHSLANSYKCGTVLIAADWGNSTYRKALAPEYKQNRKDKIAEQTEAEAERFKEFFAEYEVAVSKFRNVYRFKGVEADDIAGYLVQVLDAESIWMVSSDADWDQLVSEDVSRFSYVNRKEVRHDNWHEHYDYGPEVFLDVKSLTGDKGDNIAGVPGVGPKRAAQLIEQYGDLFNLCAHLPLEGKAKYIQAVNEFGQEGLMKNLELVDLVSFTQEAIGVENIVEIRASLKAMELLK